MEIAFPMRWRSLAARSCCSRETTSPKPTSIDAAKERPDSVTKTGNGRAPRRSNPPSRNEIKRVRHLECHLCMTAGKVASLIADIGDDRKALALDVGAGGGLVATDRSG